MSVKCSRLSLSVNEVHRLLVSVDQQLILGIQMGPPDQAEKALFSMSWVRK